MAPRRCRSSSSPLPECGDERAKKDPARCRCATASGALPDRRREMLRDSSSGASSAGPARRSAPASHAGKEGEQPSPKGALARRTAKASMPQLFARGCCNQTSFLPLKLIYDNAW